MKEYRDRKNKGVEDLVRVLEEKMTQLQMLEAENQMLRVRFGGEAGGNRPAKPG